MSPRLAPASDGNRLQALPRILEACEGTEGDGVTTQRARARTTAETINYLFGMHTSVRGEFCGTDGADITMSPSLLARLLRAARGERVDIGRLRLNPEGIDVLAATEAAKLLAYARAQQGGQP